MYSDYRFVLIIYEDLGLERLDTIPAWYHMFPISCSKEEKLDDWFFLLEGSITTQEELSQKFSAPLKRQPPGRSNWTPWTPSWNGLINFA